MEESFTIGYSSAELAKESRSRIECTRQYSNSNRHMQELKVAASDRKQRPGCGSNRHKIPIDYGVFSAIFHSAVLSNTRMEPE